MNDSSGGKDNYQILKTPKRSEISTKKTSLKSIIRADKYQYVSVIIENLANKINKLVIHAYQFLKLWILHTSSTKQKLSKITEDTLDQIFSLFMNKKSTGPKQEEAKLISRNELKSFYDANYKEFMVENKIDLGYSQQLLTYVSRDMISNIENNIKKNFFKYVFRLVNNSFKIDESNKDTPQSVIIKQKKELGVELHLVKMDMYHNTLKSDPKYHKWIIDTRSEIFPNECKKKTYEDDIISDPQKYLKHMIIMNAKLEALEGKLYHVLPLRTESIIKYITIDTKILILHVLEDKEKKQYLDNLTTREDQVWEKYFKTNNKMFRKKGYKFNHIIHTDGVGTSILFDCDDVYEKKITKKKNMKAAKEKNKLICKDKTNDEKKSYKDEINKNRKLKDEEFKEAKKKANEEFKKENKIKRDKKIEITDEEKLQKQKEFPYLQDLTQTQIDKLKDSKLVYVDPGKIRLYTMIDDEGKVFKYSNREYMRRIKKDKYSKKLNKLREKLKILEEEKKLSSTNSKSCNIGKFKEYIKLKNEVNASLSEEYRNKVFRQYKWYSYIMKQREIKRMIHCIKQTYGENCKLIMGDWSPSIQMKNFVSTPMIGLKRKLRQDLEIINLDEFKTSKLNHITKEECENLELLVWVPKKGEDKKIIYDENKKMVKEQKLKKIHSILTYKKGKVKNCINRDINSVKNMRDIVKYWFENKKRPIEFTRDNLKGKKKSVHSNKKGSITPKTKEGSLLKKTKETLSKVKKRECSIKPKRIVKKESPLVTKLSSTKVINLASKSKNGQMITRPSQKGSIDRVMSIYNKK